MIELEKRTFQEVTSPAILDRVAQVKEQWTSVTKEDVIKAAVNDVVEVAPTDKTSRAIIIKPDVKDFDETESIVLDAPGMNGYYPHLYLRAKVMQQIVAPEKRIVFLPNNGGGQHNYSLDNMTQLQSDMFKSGDMMPLAVNRVRTLEMLDDKFSLGGLMLTGFSQGGKVVLQTAVASQKSDLEVLRVDSNEAPSKKGRTARRMSTDFMKSSGNWGEAVEASEIPALSSILSPAQRLLGMAKFMLKDNMTADAKLMRAGMSHDIEFDFYSVAVLGNIPTKLGYVKDSRVLDPSNIDGNKIFRDANARLVEYYGEGTHQHATGDNVISHALMVNDGLYPAQPAK